MALWSKRKPPIQREQKRLFQLHQEDLFFKENSFYIDPPQYDPYNIEMVENQHGNISNPIEKNKKRKLQLIHPKQKK